MLSHHDINKNHPAVESYSEKDAGDSRRVTVQHKRQQDDCVDECKIFAAKQYEIDTALQLEGLRC